MPIWNPGQYLKFGAERTQPSRDLCARIPGEPGRILDLGCGPGNSTAVLRERWPGAQLAGLDSSPAMIERARADRPGDTWILADARGYEPPAALDLVFSNAALQWLPEHRALFPRLMGWLAPGGCLAVQMPAKDGTTLRGLLGTVAARPRWRTALAGAEGALTFEDAAFYYDVLAAAGTRVELWETVYYHQMASHEALIEWYEGTGMRPYLERLQGTGPAEFKAEVLEACRGEYPLAADGRVLMPFRRLFFMAWR